MGQLPVLPQQDFIETPAARPPGRSLKSVTSARNNCLFCVVADKRVLGDKTNRQIKQELLEILPRGQKTESC
jgi:hypothetical protein